GAVRPAGDPEADGATTAAPEVPLFTRQADPTVNPVPDPELLEMEEIAPGHRVSRIFRDGRAR
ncbi:MAG: hypothetical protein ACLFR8_12820, partial [Alkalispirochaeta sp.]